MSRLHFLYATDGSLGAAEALELLVGSFNPAAVETVEVLAVVPRVARWPAPGREDHGPILVIETVHREDAERTVQAACDRLADAGFRTIATVRAGHPAEAIVQHAILRRPDLVLTGTRGRGDVQRRLAGSVSGKVARYSPTSVLVTRTTGPIRRIVLGYDASPDAERVLELVTRLPLQAAPEVTVCTVYEVIAPLTSGIAPTMVLTVEAAYGEELREARIAAEAIAADGAARLRDRGVSADSRALHGSPREQLAVLSAELGADLLVVGSRGLSGIRRFLLGGTSAALLAQPPTNVLVARGQWES